MWRITLSKLSSWTNEKERVKVMNTLQVWTFKSVVVYSTRRLVDLISHQSVTMGPHSVCVTMSQQNIHAVRESVPLWSHFKIVKRLSKTRTPAGATGWPVRLRKPHPRVTVQKSGQGSKFCFWCPIAATGQLSLHMHVRCMHVDIHTCPPGVSSMGGIAPTLTAFVVFNMFSTFSLGKRTWFCASSQTSWRQFSSLISFTWCRIVRADQCAKQTGHCPSSWNTTIRCFFVLFCFCSQPDIQKTKAKFTAALLLQRVGVTSQRGCVTYLTLTSDEMGDGGGGNWKVWWDRLPKPWGAPTTFKHFFKR